jgi:hypothetical protein
MHRRPNHPSLSRTNNTLTASQDATKTDYDLTLRTTLDQGHRHLSITPHPHALAPLTVQWNGMFRLGQYAKMDVGILINNTVRRPP